MEPSLHQPDEVVRSLYRRTGSVPMLIRRALTLLIEVALGLTAAVTAGALQDRSELYFPLTFHETKRWLGDRLERGVDVEVRFAVVNPTNEPVTYSLKPSSRRVRVNHKDIEIVPGETQEIEVKIENKMPGPFRFRIGVLVGSTRAALFVEGAVVE